MCMAASCNQSDTGSGAVSTAVTLRSSSTLMLVTLSRFVRVPCRTIYRYGRRKRTWSSHRTTNRRSTHDGRSYVQKLATASLVGRVPMSGVRGRESQRPSHQPELTD